ncbi:MAG: hypothetical protein K2X03_11315 [Bryobacteraceae bacterium]|nr:hypothetical protein [Bryobacteraceae bacterium]
MKRYLTVFFITTCRLAAQQFHPDDPLEFELTPLNVEAAAKRKLSDYYDIIRHTIDTPGDLNAKRAKPARAQAVNTLGEPLQGAWWVKRHYYHPMTKDRLIAGPGNNRPPSQSGQWKVISAKNEGITPGFVILDSKNDMYFVKFDPLSNPGMATGADHISIRLMYALGYHVPENYLVEFPEEILTLGKNVTVADRLGHPQPMTRRDLHELLLKVPKTARGQYRATASLAIPGKGIGPYRYFGVRTDDPNDFIPHEHRRDLRGLGVISAWIGHDDSRAINTYDALVEENAVKFIRHYVLDLGSTLGSGTQKANSPRSGGEYLFDWKTPALQLLTLGALVPRWGRADFSDLPAVGRFESKRFDANNWVPEYPNPAFLNRLPDDEFWAAKQIMAIRDEEIRAIVESAHYSDPRATDWISQVLIERRDKIGRAVFAKLLPLDRFRIVGGKLVFDDLSAVSGFAPPVSYEIHWSTLTNVYGTSQPIQDATGTVLPPNTGYLIAHVVDPLRPSQTVDVTIRKDNSDSMAEIVGIDRHW